MARFPLFSLACLVLAGGAPAVGPGAGAQGAERKVRLPRDELLAASPGGRDVALLQAGLELTPEETAPDGWIRVTVAGWLPPGALEGRPGKAGSQAGRLFALHRAARASSGPVEAPGMHTVRVDAARPTVRGGRVLLTLTAVGRNRGSFTLSGLGVEFFLRDERGREILRVRGRVATGTLAPGQETVAEATMRLSPGQARAFHRRRTRVRWLLEPSS